MSEKQMGIYCITNTINQNKYVGQSININLRWRKHISSAFNKNINAENYNYPLYRAMRKYGLNNFQFDILELVADSKYLDEREIYWIKILSPKYNQTKGGGYCIHKSIPNKLSIENVNEIQQLLINGINCSVSHKELAKKYNVTKDTIQSINTGRTWYNPQYGYPLHYSKYDSNKPDDYYIFKKDTNICKQCGATIASKSKLCVSCYNENRKITLPPKNELQELIYIKPFTDIGKFYNVSDNTIREWCKQYGLPYKYRDIHKKEIKEKKISGKPVKALSLNDDEFFVFESISNAANWLIQEKMIKSQENGIRSHISEVCKGKRKTAYGYMWEYIS